MSSDVTIACAMELYEKGYIPEKDVPFPIKFGDETAMIKLVQMIAAREGIGNLLAEGSYRLAEHYGHPEISMSIKKQTSSNLISVLIYLYTDTTITYCRKTILNDWGWGYVYHEYGEDV